MLLIISLRGQVRGDVDLVPVQSVQIDCLGLHRVHPRDVIIESSRFDHHPRSVVRQTVARLIDGVVQHLAPLGPSEDHEASARVVDLVQDIVDSCVYAVLDCQDLKVRRPGALGQRSAEQKLTVPPLAVEVAGERSAIRQRNLKIKANDHQSKTVLHLDASAFVSNDTPLHDGLLIAQIATALSIVK